ncbi:hypothetical protein SAMN06265340_101275 [Desulfurobacterium atlanticum]|uniref:Uncharacterized protein n=2 Tax=Desulfurobacterium atlanticum TaxID=240169 RepID=A0A238XVN8_9BACT|nr:hypothetical protein SAMN06265340_101275 [Desulfurobacterium atlanticum]
MATAMAVLFSQKASAKTYSAFYGTYIDYSSGNKTSGYSGTFYLNTGDLYQSTSFGISATRVEEKTEETVSFQGKQRTEIVTDYIDQLDFTLLYTNTDKILKNHIFSFGFHYILTDDKSTNNGSIFYFDGTYFKPYNWNSGLEFAVSFYPSTKVFQFVPHLGKYFYTKNFTYYTWVKGYYIKVGDTADFAFSKTNYFSGEFGVHFYKGNFDAGVFLWGGEQVFAVKNSGFVVYNLGDVYKGGIVFDGGYKIDKNYRVGFTASLNRFEYPDTGENAVQTSVTGYVGYTW